MAEPVFYPKVAETIDSWDFVFPNDANPYGSMFGGKLLAIMDTTAAIAAIRYAGRTVSTAAVEAVEFVHPVVVGDRLKTSAKVVHVGRSSMMVRVDVYVDHGGNDFQRCTHAHFAMVAFDDRRKPTPVPPLKIETPEDQAAFDLAASIRANALERAKQAKQQSKT
ncbi:MAG: acyl-CoA thioesterase [Pseudomonadota bacterium]